MSQRNLTPDEATARAAKLAERGQLTEAAKLYQQVLRAQPANKKARKALKALQGRGSSAATLTEHDFQRVVQLMGAKKLDAARTEVQRLCRVYPQESALHNLHGVVLSGGNDKESALTAFQEALRLEPAFAEALFNLASTLSDLGRNEEALGCYQELVNRGQADAAVHANLARALRDAGQLDNAEKALRRAIQLKPRFPDAYNSLGNLLNHLGRHEEAVEACQSALQMAPQHRKALQNLALSLGKLGKWTRALGIYRQLLELDSGNLRALSGAAEALTNLGQRTAAIERYEQVLKMNPRDAVAAHMIDALKGSTPTATRTEYAKDVFESYAANFEAHLNALGYGLPERLPALLETLDGENAWYSRALDLGCGTGLVGAQLRSYCDHLTGIDIASAMVRKAKEKAVYDDLQVGDLLDTLPSLAGEFNLLVCADVLVYIADLADLFAAARQRCAPGAAFIISTELLESGDFKLLPSGRFAHSDDYIASAAGAAGFSLRHSEHIPLRKEKGTWLTGGLYVLTAG